MKKWAYLLSGIVIGAIVATSTSAVAAQVKSLIGQKVTGEYTVIVNGKELADKGAVIAGKTNAPVRDLADALGVELKVSEKKIIINNTDSIQAEDSKANDPKKSDSGNKYIGGNRSNLETLKDSIQNNRINPAVEERKRLSSEIETLKETEAKGVSVPVLAEKEKQLKEYDEIINKANEELRLVNEALDKLGE